MDKKILFKKVEARLHAYKYLQIQIDNLELEIKRIENNYDGYRSMSYDEKTGVTYNISRTIENEIIAKEKKLSKLIQAKVDKEIEKKKIENALTCLDIIETDFFNLFYNSKSKNNMKYISMKMHMDRSHCYRLREKIVFKIMSMLHSEIQFENLPLFQISG